MKMILCVGSAAAVEDATTATARDIPVWIAIHVLYATGRVYVLIAKVQAELDKTEAVAASFTSPFLLPF